ncbi:MAG: hypothetical protein ACK5JT_11845, partial [Hyphomicrobiaceae bacterium]
HPAIHRFIPLDDNIGFAVITGLFIALSIVATRSPFAIIATGVTLDSWTGYYRLLIWQHGLENVFMNPMFGLGLYDWARPSWMASPTVDAFWLVVAMRSGIPAFLFLITTVLLIVWGTATRIPASTGERRAMSRGWLISIAAISLVGCTVHFWNVPYAFFFFLLGAGGWFADPMRVLTPVARHVAQQTAKATRIRWVDPGHPHPAQAGVGPRYLIPVLAAPLPRRSNLT